MQDCVVGESSVGEAVLRFRLAVPEDVDEIVALVNSAYRGEVSRQGWTTEADLLGGQRTDAREVEQLITGPDSVMLVCHRNEMLIGCVQLQRGRDRAYLGMLAVRPHLQGAGVGKRFMEAAEDFIRDRWRLGVVEMTVIFTRHELIAYYQRRGYRLTGERRPFPLEERFGLPKVDRLEFVVLEKHLC
ncbi:MAG: GNAT family N-acetyltransferase [Ectothiorhodospiraceae bacterium]|nr:GNAT family N-acetyltransferase [Ectothiorhodospiraceae bacterium]